MELRSGSGVLRGGDRAKGVMGTGDLICRRVHLMSEFLEMAYTPQAAQMPANSLYTFTLLHHPTPQLWEKSFRFNVMF